MANFRGYKRSIVLEFDYDQVKEGIPNVKKQMAILNSEFKKASQEAEISGNSLDKLRVKYDYLREKIKIQEQEVENYRKQLEKAEKAEGNNAKAVQNATTSLEIAQNKLGQTRAELEKVSKELEKNKTILGKTSEEWEKLGQKTGDIGKNLTTKLTVPILGAAAASFKLGADLEDAIGKTNAVFKQNAREIEQWAENAYSNFGLAKTTALDMANSFGALASGMGLNSIKVKEYSQALTELAVDMVAFHGGRLDVAETALNSIFTGETESLKKYGIVMTEANLQQYAHTKGIREKISDMTEAEKVQLRYNFVMDKSKDVIGHYQREQDNATTQLLKFQEGLKKVGESFSNQILPLFTPFLETINSVIEKFANLDDRTKKFIVTIGGIVAVAGPILLVVSSVFKAISNVSDGMEAAGKIMDKLKDGGKLFSGALDNTKFFGFAKWALVIAAVAAAIGFLISQINILLGKGQQANRAMSDMANLTGSINNTAIRGYDVGTNYVTHDQVAVIHKGEAIIPAESNPWNPNATRYDELGNGSKGDTFVFNVDISQVDDLIKYAQMQKRAQQTARAY